MPKTRAPRSRKSFEVAKPMPLLQPVIITTLDWTLLICDIAKDLMLLGCYAVLRRGFHVV
jgi:hypothetical protein